MIQDKLSNKVNPKENRYRSGRKGEIDKICSPNWEHGGVWRREDQKGRREHGGEGRREEERMT